MMQNSQNLLRRTLQAYKQNPSNNLGKWNISIDGYNFQIILTCKYPLWNLALYQPDRKSALENDGQYF